MTNNPQKKTLSINKSKKYQDEIDKLIIQNLALVVLTDKLEEENEELKQQLRELHVSRNH